jgi:TolA-binding protein
MQTIGRASWHVLLLALLVSGRTGLTSGQEQNASATQQYSAAVAMQNRGDYRSAAEQWVKFIDAFKTDSRCDRAFHYLGVCYLKTNQLDLARQCFEIVVKHYPKFDLLDATYYCLGSTLYNLGQSGKTALYDAAADAFEAVITKYPRSELVSQALFHRGECFYQRGKKQEAAETYTQWLTKFPGDKRAADVLYALGVSQEELGQSAEAGKSYDQFLGKYPKNSLAAEVTVRRAAILAQEQKYARAATLYASISAKWPQSKLLAVAGLAGGKCYYLAGNFAAAQKVLAQLVAADGPSLGEAAHWLLRSLLKGGKAAEAAATAERLLPKLADGPQAAQVRLDRADAVYELPGRRGESVALYAAIAAEHPQASVAPEALYLAGFAALGMGDYPTALRHATAFLTAYPHSKLVADATYVEAESHLQLGHFAEAEKCFGQLLQKYPAQADAETWQVHRGLSLYLQKKYAETIDWLQPKLANLQGPEALAEANYLLGGSQVELKQFEAAAKSLEASLAAAPKWRQADQSLLLLAQADGELHRDQQAKMALRRLITDFPESHVLDRAHYRLGELAYAGGDLPAATAEYGQVVDRWPRSPLVPRALYGLGWTKLGQNDYASAERLFDTMLEKYPHNKLAPRARYARGIARHQRKDFSSAIDDVQALLAADPTPAEKSDARYLLGLCHTGLKHYDEAAASFQAILHNDPQYPGADKVLYEWAWALEQQDKQKEAAEVFARLAAEHADSPLAAEAQYHMGESAYQSDRFHEAVAAYRTALVKAGRSAWGEKVAHKLGWSYFQQGDFVHAQQTFHEQRTIWPAGPLSGDAAFMEAESLAKQRKFTEALATYEQVKNPAGKDFPVLTLLHAGQAAGELKQWGKCRDWLAKCIAQFPDSPYLPEARCEQARAQQNLGQLDNALALYQKVIAGTGREAAARSQFGIGEIQFQQKKYVEAKKSFFKVAYGYSYPRWQAAATYQSGRCFEALGMKGEAIKQYRELLEKYPQSDQAPPAKRRIAELQK